MATMDQPLAARHIQNYTEASSLEPHWGYVSRAVPCTNDAGSCAYLDLVYGSHDRGMLYSGILWCTLGGVLFLWALGRRLWPSRRADEIVNVDTERELAAKSSSSRLRRSLACYGRSYLLPDSVRSVFGRTTRLQVLVLAVLSGYLLIWSFVGITYKTWITPVKSSPGLYNTRTSIGPWSDRVGILAYALTPLSILLSSRESILSLLTGVPYQSFNFLHRWLGYIIFAQGSLHTMSWCIVEIKLYNPQPTTAVEWITQTYMIWGLVAMTLLLLLFVLSMPFAIRLTGYEFFRKAHYVLAMLYIGACWGHWEQLKCFLLPGLLIWFLDRGVRYARSAMLHYGFLPDGSVGFKAAHANLTHFADAEHGDVVRMDFSHSQDAWKIGQHFYICFAECSIWQSHPFTPLNLPVVKGGVVAHSYIFRAKKGETKKVAELALKKLSENKSATTPLILSGSYGESIAENLTPHVNVLCVAGGTGITYVLPVLLSLVQQPAMTDRKIELIWAIRKRADMGWVEQELNIIRQAAKTHEVPIHIFVTREQSSASLLDDSKTSEKDANVKETGSGSSSSSSLNGALSSSSLEVKRIGGRESGTHPDLQKMVGRFVENTVRGPTTVYASGPGGMISDLRAIVASCNSGAKVWKGNERFDVRLTYDDRLEW
ncbi:ferric reductase like transmembrane component-domain-containing protein [Pseudomassariella vexata]|uniref:Ferric reductase like transmembrane component-domain-containing protein n=1 Tax=Pseudomassariella vexata TaxID=1141098 RepID=A0A1Y2EHC8_9PEZI|nr:ferric reductase like transmembrane component-domain-containing protein [Pseudomassariella vexata]ORY70970.1 ferric reductase like transmembrane component-domain-containing protein [Pseudomassariella vexata]